MLHRLRGGQSHKKRYIEYNNCKVIIVIDDNTKVCCIQKHFKSLVPQILSISILSLAIFLGRNSLINILFKLHNLVIIDNETFGCDVHSNRTDILMFCNLELENSSGYSHTVLLY